MRAALALITLGLLVTGCNSAPKTQPAAKETQPAVTYPPRPTVVPPPFRVFHQDNDTYTLVTKENATDDEIAAILWQLRDAARDHSFDKLHLSQKFIDARKPIIWIHVYRGAKCAAEKYTTGKYPCGASYHGAGDFTYGDYKNSNWTDGELQNGNGSQTALWDADKPYTAH